MEEKVWTKYSIKHISKNRAKIIMTTNDNNNDGKPDGYTASWNHETEIWIALELAGEITHKGIFGEKVEVYIGDKLITEDNYAEIKSHTISDGKDISCITKYKCWCGMEGNKAEIMEHQKFHDNETIEKNRNILINHILDKPRTEAENLEEAIWLLIKYAQEYMNIEIHIEKYPNEFSWSIVDTWLKPIGVDQEIYKNEGFPAFTGRWSGEIITPKRSKRRITLGDIMKEESPHEEAKNVFRGFNSCGGLRSGKIDCHGIMYIQDFPKIYSVFKEFAYIKAKENEAQLETGKITQFIHNKINREIESDPSIRTIDSMMHDLQESRNMRQEIIKNDIESANAELFNLPESFNYDKERLKVLENLFGANSRHYREPLML